MAGIDKQFFKDLDRELAARSVSGSDRGRERPAQPQRRQSALVGEPGSAERFEHVASLIPDPQIRQQLVTELSWGAVGSELQNILFEIQHVEESPAFTGDYPPETVERFTQAARLLGQIGDPRLYQAFEQQLGESELVEYLQPAVEQAATEGRIEQFGLMQAQAQSHLDRRAKMLEAEYSDIERHFGRDGLEAADQLAQNLDQSGTLYNPNADELHLRGALRSTAVTAAATQRGLRKAAWLTELDSEIARRHGPGSRWNDADRAEWERELRESTVVQAHNEFGDPARHGDAAVDSIIRDDRRRATGKTETEEALEREFEKMDEHNSRSEHARALRAEDVREWEETHLPNGQPTTQIDGLGREHGTRLA